MATPKVLLVIAHPVIAAGIETLLAMAGRSRDVSTTRAAGFART